MCRHDWRTAESRKVSPVERLEAMLKRSSGRHTSTAQYNLAAIYDSGRSQLGPVQINKPKAMQLYAAAAAAGHSGAAYNLALSYHEGDGMPRNPAKAAEYYAVASRLGHYSAQCNFGSMLARREGGVEPGRSADSIDIEASKWLRSAADDGGDFMASSRIQSFYPRAHVEYNVGDSLQVHGLKSAPSLNGLIGQVVSSQSTVAPGRVVVLLQSGDEPPKQRAIRFCNLRVAAGHSASITHVGRSGMLLRTKGRQAVANFWHMMLDGDDQSVLLPKNRIRVEQLKMSNFF